MHHRFFLAVAIALFLNGAVSMRVPTVQLDPPARALANFGLAMKPLNPARNALGPEIMSRGSLVPSWNASCLQKPGGKCDGLYHLDTYEDDMVFEYMFKEASLYEFGVPILSSRGGRAQPAVEDYSTDVEQGTGEIRVWHNCARISEEAVQERSRMVGGNIQKLEEMDTSYVTMTLKLRADVSVTVGWRKVCGYGTRKHLDYGIEVADSARSLRIQGRGVKVGPEAVSSRVFLRATGRVPAPHFLTPTVTAVHDPTSGLPVVVPLLRGWEGDASGAWFYVLYGCESLGVGTITATIALPPFKDVSMTWEKDCGGGLETSLNVVGDIKDRRSGIIVQGRAVNEFAREALVGDDNRVPHSADSVSFFVSAREGISIGPPSASSNDGRIVLAEIVGSLREGGTLGENEKRIDIRVRCRKVGDVRVTVTVPVVDRVAAEWIFYKQCFGPQDERRSSRPLWLFIGAIVVLWVLIVLQKVSNAVPQKSGLFAKKTTRFE